MNGATTVGPSEDLCIQHRPSQNETGSEQPQSPNSPLSVRHGKLLIIQKIIFIIEPYYFFVQIYEFMN